MHGVLLAQVDLPAAHGRGAWAQLIVLRSHAVARRVTFGTETVGFLEPAFHGLRAIGHPSRAVALLTGMVASKVPVTAHRGYLRSGGKRRKLPSPRRVRRRSRRTPSPLALYAGVRTQALETGVVRLYGVVVILGRWARAWCARLCVVHKTSPYGP